MDTLHKLLCFNRSMYQMLNNKIILFKNYKNYKIIIMLIIKSLIKIQLNDNIYYF